MKFKEYLKRLAEHEALKSSKYLKDPLNEILVHSGIALNWLGDFVSNPKLKWEKLSLKVDEILFTGTDPKTNKILIEKCERSPAKLLSYLKDNSKDKKYIESIASDWDLPILLRKKDDKYLLLDGMHRFIGLVINEKNTIEAYVAINFDEELPQCEPHVVYDLIRGYQ